MFQISMMVPAFHVLFYFRNKLYDIILPVSTLRSYSRFFGKYFIWYFIGPGAEAEGIWENLDWERRIMGEFRGSLKGENAGEMGEAPVKERRRRMRNLL